MAGEVFSDGEPVDPKKLQSLQNQIDAIKLRSDESYDLSKATAGDVSKLAVMHLRAGVVSFTNGIGKGKTGISRTIPLKWEPEYEAVFVVATPRFQDLSKNNLTYSITGTGTAGGTTTLNVFSTTGIAGLVEFDWISAGRKPIPSE
jgi:hypothetical protein